jgi:hypothetical protein
MFDMIAKQLETQTLNRGTQFKISKEEFEKFCKEYLFDEIKGIKLGPAFCEKYNDRNFILLGHMLSNEAAKQHIKQFYIK